MKAITERQQEILDYICEYTRREQYPPTIREIGTATGITSTSAVNYQLDELARKGYIVRRKRASRGIRVIGAAA